MLNKKDALDAAIEIQRNARVYEEARLDRIDQAVSTPFDMTKGIWTPSVSIPEDAPPIMKELAFKAETNYLPMLLQNFSQVLKVDGVIMDGRDDGNPRDPWIGWQRNRMDARQVGLHRSTLKYGTSYATIMPGEVDPVSGIAIPRIDLYSPKDMTAIYQDAESDEWPMMALAIRGRHAYLFEEGVVHNFGFNDNMPIYAAESILFSADNSFSLANMEYIEYREHDMGFCPVVRYRDRFLLGGEEQYGIVEPLIQIQQRIDETQFQALVIQYAQAFRQRIMVGWVPETEAEDIKVAAGKIHFLDIDPDEVKMIDLPETQLGDLLRSQEAVKRDFAARGNIPAQSLGVDGISNVSDATLAGLEIQRNREASEIATALGESHEQLLRTVALQMGNEAAANDWRAEVQWRPFEARTMASMIDALGKMVTQLHVPEEIAWEDIPGNSPQKLQRMKDLSDERGANDRINALRGTRPQPKADPTETPDVIAGDGGPLPDSGLNPSKV